MPSCICTYFFFDSSLSPISLLLLKSHHSFLPTTSPRKACACVSARSQLVRAAISFYSLSNQTLPAAGAVFIASGYEDGHVAVWSTSNHALLACTRIAEDPGFDLDQSAFIWSYDAVLCMEITRGTATHLVCGTAGTRYASVFCTLP